MNFAPAKNGKIIRLCIKLHNYVIRKSKEAGSDYGTVGVFHDDNVHPQYYGIKPLQGDGPNGNSDFGFLATQANADEQILFSTLDVDSSRLDSMVADIESSSIRCPEYNVERNEYN